jgi:hypothetical protein
VATRLGPEKTKGTGGGISVLVRKFRVEHFPGGSRHGPDGLAAHASAPRARQSAHSLPAAARYCVAPVPVERIRVEKFNRWAEKELNRTKMES